MKATRSCYETISDSFICQHFTQYTLLFIDHYGIITENPDYNQDLSSGVNFKKNTTTRVRMCGISIDKIQVNKQQQIHKCYGGKCISPPWWLKAGRWLEGARRMITSHVGKIEFKFVKSLSC
jgi:hypothetical protein